MKQEEPLPDSSMRLYAPKASVLGGSWNPPPVRKVD